jgi:ribosomal protein S18 acetylase RimI-like enzyme
MGKGAQPAAGEEITIRSLIKDDLDAVVEIDAALGRLAPRRGYFERRLGAALASPELHVQFAAEHSGALVGFALARRLVGEFGAVQPALRLEVIGVESSEQGAGIATRLLARLQQSAVHGGAAEIRTQASWRDGKMLHFLDHAGFSLATDHVIDCAVRVERFDAAEHEEVEAPETGESWKTPETDYSAAADNDFEAALGRDRIEARSLAAGDFDEVARIDRRITGVDRSAYLRQVFAEALGNSGVRASLVARKDGMTVGFVMARTDFGDFGRTEPVAVLDTIGVDPDFAHAGVGRSLLSQLFLNLQALRVERLETVVARGDFALLGFLYAAGFAPAERLAFVRSAV